MNITLADTKTIIMPYNSKENKIPKAINFLGEKHFKLS